MKDIQITGEVKRGYESVLTKEAIEFVAHLHRKFNGVREGLLNERIKQQQKINAGVFPDFPEETTNIRNGDWKVAPIPDDLQDRRTEITGPVDRKMVINALNSGAKVFMADLEDANSPTWTNCVEGQINLRDAIIRKIDFTAANGKHYKLKEETAVLLVRPRGWHLEEKHVLVDGVPISASLFDFGLYFFHNAKALLEQNTGPYFYIPKLESYKEARLWNDVFVEAQQRLNIPIGTIKVTVLIETILASFQIEEILFELRDQIVGMNAGRWDYIFSVIKKFRNHKRFILPDRSQITMGVPFMKSYAELLVKVCHKRGAHAIGGMSAFIPSKDGEINKRAFEKVAQDKKNEAAQGYDGTWVAHPFLVPVAMEQFNAVLKNAVHQKHILREDVNVSATNLIDTSIERGKITEEGVRTNINVGILYIESWLQGVGAAALYNLMEDAATAEISRAQLWQWLHSEGVKLDDGRAVDWPLYEKLFDEEKQKAATLLGNDRVATGKLATAAQLFDNMVRTEDFEDFLTLEAYEKL